MDEKVPAEVQEYMNAETSKQMHLPFHNYAGPGTHVANNIVNKVMPTTLIDQASLIHDIEYVKPSNQWKADNNMYKNLLRAGGIKYLPIANHTRLAFLAKDVSQLKSDDKTSVETYNYLKKLAISNNMVNKNMKFSDN